LKHDEQIAAIFMLLIVAALTGIACGHRPESLTGLTRVETLWRGPETIVARYVRPAGFAIDKDQDVIVCEESLDKVVIRSVPIDNFAAVQGNTLAFYNQQRVSTPGWYIIKRNHALSWFKRIFGGEALGEITPVMYTISRGRGR
jgi:hypothetical protein